MLQVEPSRTVGTKFNRPVERLTIIACDGLEIEDKIPFTLWGKAAVDVEQNFKAGDSIKVTCVIAKHYQGSLELNSTRDSQVFRIFDDFLDMIEVDDSADGGISASLISYEPKSVSSWPMCPGMVCRKKRVS